LPLQLIARLKSILTVVIERALAQLQRALHLSGSIAESHPAPQMLSEAAFLARV
jgi:hypothetical protein